MLKRDKPAGSTVKVTFTVPTGTTPVPSTAADDRPVSVVGDFNGWDPLVHPLKRRSNGTRSVSVVLPVGTVHRFKYLAADGDWFCDDAADGWETNEYGEVNALVRT
jgi:hypothetical protein